MQFRIFYIRRPCGETGYGYPALLSSTFRIPPWPQREREKILNEFFFSNKSRRLTRLPPFRLWESLPYPPLLFFQTAAILNLARCFGGNNHVKGRERSRCFGGEWSREGAGKIMWGGGHIVGGATRVPDILIIFFGFLLWFRGISLLYFPLSLHKRIKVCKGWIISIVLGLRLEEEV